MTTADGGGKDAGEKAWMSPWKQVHPRKAGARP